MNSPIRFALSASLLALGCSTAPPSDAPTVPVVSESLTAARTAPSCLPDCAGSRAYDAIAYDLQARYDWTQRQLIGREQITLALTDAANAVVELDSAVQISAVHAGGRALPFAADAAARTVRIDLSSLHARFLPVTFTVEYTVAPSDGFVAFTSRDADPVTSRVVYTDSEPDRGSQWLVANHHPDDRAFWSVEVTVEKDEDVVANGERIFDRHDCDGRRVVRYAMPAPLPTYLMAFAGGQLVHKDRRVGRLPLSVWYRRGLSIVPDQTLDEVADAMGTFEKLLGPYPFERYAVVLLPDFPGGMENATITFNSETSSQGPLQFELDSHELGHHWFGDWVTMHNFEDAWVKEGMATVLEVEADRARRDTSGSGRLFGTDFTFNPDDAVVDPTLSGIDRYTSGLYQRAGWLITQIRAKVGEKQFWATLRKVLREHALDSITGPQFLQSFAPALDQASIDQLIATLPKKPTPAVSATFDYQPTGRVVTLTLDDPSGAIITPPTMRVIGADGVAGPAQPLAVGQPTSVTVPFGGYLDTDELDVHPGWSDSFTTDPDQFGQLASLLVPWAPPASATLLARSSAHQERALNTDGYVWVGADQFADFYGALDSTQARWTAGLLGCYQIYYGGGAQTPNPWVAAVGPILQHPALNWESANYSYCGADLATQYLAADFGATGHALDAGNAGHFSALLGFGYDNALAFDVLADVTAHAPSLQMREYALRRAVWQLAGTGRYMPVAPGEQPAWAQLMRDRLAESTSQGHFDLVWRGVKGLHDDSALAIVGAELHKVTDMTPGYARQLLCDAYALGSARPGAWAELQAAAQPWGTLPAAAQAVLADASVCAQPLAPLATAARVRTNVVGLAPAVVTGGVPANRPDARVGERRAPAPSTSAAAPARR